MFLPPNPNIDRRALYMEAHDLNTKISQAINVAFEERAADPIARVIELLSAKKMESFKEQAMRIAELEKQNRKLERQNEKVLADLAEAEERLRVCHSEKNAQMLRANALQARITQLEAENNVMYIDTMEMSRSAPPCIVSVSSSAVDLESVRSQCRQLSAAWLWSQ